MPGVEVTSSSTATFSFALMSISRPCAIFGALAAITCAVHAVEVSPSIARLGSPNPDAGYSYGLYVEAAFVSSRIALCWDSSLVFSLGVVLVGVVFVVPVLISAAGVLVVAFSEAL